MGLWKKYLLFRIGGNEMSFNAHDKQIGEILNRAVFDIPRNQRRYVWTENNWKELLEDVVFSSRKDVAPHFIGSIVLENRGKKDGIDYYTIIDGQQRITTIVIALIAIMKLLVEYGMDDDYFGTLDYVRVKNNRNQTMSIIASDYHVSLENLIEGIGEREIISNQTMSVFIDTKIVSKKKDEVLGNALKYYYNEIKCICENCGETTDKLLEIRNAIINMTIVCIVSDSAEDSYTIFEILNARGQELEEHELLKNYIMRYIQPVDRRDVAKVKWEEMEIRLGNYFKRYISHYARHRFGKVQGDTDSDYRIIYKNTKGTDINILLNDIKLKSEYYLKFVNPQIQGEDKNCTETEYEIFSFFKKKRQEQFRPVVLSLLHQKDLGNLSESLYEQSIKFMYNFFVCYTLIGEEKSNKLQDVVYKYAVILENDYSYDNLREFGHTLKGKIPSYEWFLNSFRNLGWSNHSEMFKGSKNKQRVQITLEIIEKYVSQKFEVPKFTIEHILPDSENDENAHIGNLIPLESKLNHMCGNKSLEEKYMIYKDSDFITARNINQRFNGKSFNISRRTEYLCKLVYNNILELTQLDYSEN